VTQVFRVLLVQWEALAFQEQLDTKVTLVFKVLAELKEIRVRLDFKE
tara:strand:+ start:371 stop:511 length:141 start_codon:yes stop_codon:yes gene_type:complete